MGAVVFREREAPGKRCCSASVADLDAAALVGRLRDVFPDRRVTVRQARAIVYGQRRGLFFITYAFELDVAGLAWKGSGRPSEPELLNPLNWS